MKKISILTPCYNEEGNVKNLYEAVKKVMQSLPQYEYEHIFIDNCSQDKTETILEEIALHDHNVRVIENLRNFGPGRSGSYGFFQTSGDASICLACDFQDPPELIPEFVDMWEKGYKVVWGKKTASEESKAMFAVRGLYYKIIRKSADTKQYEQVTGFGLYDREVVSKMRDADEPSPNFRNLVAELGYQVGFIEYAQPKRAAGKSSYTFSSYMNTAIDSFVNTSRLPMLMAIYIGIFTSLLSFVAALVLFIIQLCMWGSVSFVFWYIILTVLFAGGIILFFQGVFAEYIGEILLRVTKRPLVVEKKRINFDEKSDDRNIL